MDTFILLYFAYLSLDKSNYDLLEASAALEAS